MGLGTRQFMPILLYPSRYTGQETLRLVKQSQNLPIDCDRTSDLAIDESNQLQATLIIIVNNAA